MPCVRFGESIALLAGFNEMTSEVFKTSEVRI